MAEILFPALFVLLALGLPVAFAMAISVFVALSFGSSYPNLVVVKEMFSGLDSFPLLAVPFFILAAEIMTGGAVTLAMLRLAQSLVGHLKGGLGHANVVSSAMFAGISGSALADAAGPGTMMIRMMEKGGYGRAYAGALTISSSVVGPIIPPSITMIIYAMQDQQVSVGSLFMAGVLPGILITAAVLLANARVSHKRGYASGAPMPPLGEIARIALYALPALMLVVLIVGGIRFGVFTPTEASVIAVFYALFVGMFLPVAAGRGSARNHPARGPGVGGGAVDPWRGAGLCLGVDHRRRAAVSGRDDHCLGSVADCLFAGGECAVAGLWPVYGPAARGDDPCADPCADQLCAWDRPGSFRDYRDCEPDPWSDHTAGGKPDFCRLVGGEHQAIGPDQGNATVLYRTDGGVAVDHLYPCAVHVVADA